MYPRQTKDKDFLEHYIQHFNSIELNATRYKIYNESEIKKWTDKVGNKDFIFCPKMFQGITHQGSLTDKNTLLAEFLKKISAFEKYLGPIFIQLSETFSPARKNELFTFLKFLPSDFQFFLEVRHPNWFDDISDSNQLFAALKNTNIGAIITDTAGRRDCVHMHLTTPQTFIRYTGSGLLDIDRARLDEWAERIHYWFHNGLKDLYFFMHTEDSIYAPELAAYWIDQLNTSCGLHLEKPKLLPTQSTLFE